MVERKNIRLKPDPERVILRFFFPGNESRAKKVAERVISLDERKAEKLYEEVLKRFSSRHKNIENSFLKNFQRIQEINPSLNNLSQTKKLLTGSYFSMEYSIESAALFNPSIVPAPDQSGLSSTELRFIMSLRATGEGHISSIEFRSGIIENKNVKLDEITRFAALAPNREERVQTEFDEAATADANYNISFSGDEPVSERVIFPFSKTESNGIEDVRFVKFLNTDGSSTYYGTFTAYDGHKILSQLIQTDDFISFKIRTLHGEKAKDKGMALFPKKVNNKYSIISRLDGENLYFMQSDNIYLWENASVIRTPEYDWEFIQIGNCGSPIETDEGWLLMTHAVGPMRRYVVSALLLDKENPAKITGWLDEPLLEPMEDEREGYVPNVVYSCGSLIHNGELIIPYAVSDSASGFASVSVEKLLERFIRQ